MINDAVITELKRLWAEHVREVGEYIHDKHNGIESEEPACPERLLVGMRNLIAEVGAETVRGWLA